jgi:hypothetical protein
VLAGVRRTIDGDRIRADGIEPVMLDITLPEDISALASRIAAEPPRRPLRAVVNNAGVEINAPVEVLPLDLWRSRFEVNLFGHIAVVQALLPTLRASRGRIVNITPVGGEVALPIHGAYAGTKFAEHTGLYGGLIASSAASQPAFLKRALTAEKAGAKVTTRARPRTRYTTGIDAAFVIPLNPILPTRLMDRVLSARAGSSRPATV